MTRSALDYSGQQHRTEHISDRAQQIVVSPIKEIALLASTMPDVIPFAWGVPHIPTPLHIRQAVADALINDPELGYYSPSYGLPSLRQAISTRLKNSFKVEINPDTEVLVTAGAMEGLMCAIQAVVNPGDEVIVTDPGFSSHREQILLAGGVTVSWTLHDQNNWKPDIAELERLVTPRTKAILFCSPVNPTGTILSQAVLEVIATIALKHNLLVVTDEPYQFLTYDGASCPSLIADERLRNQRISCFSLSKEYAMTGYRVGYVIAEPGLIQQLLKVHDATIVSVARPSQVAALAALTGDQACVAELRNTLQQRRDIMCAELDKLSDWLEYQKPIGSYYVFARYKPSRDDMKLAFDLLYQAKVATVPGSAFGPAGKGYIRLCFGCSEENIIKGMKRIGEWLKQPHS